jgi:phospholipid-binding lipoprotein MlaA
MPMSLTAAPLLRLRAAILCVAVSLFLLGGCATSGNPRDPLEGLNRGIYKFNDGVDNLIVMPAAGAYRDLVPDFIRTGVSNFFANINDVLIALNSLLQGKLLNAVSDVGRIAVNTTAGLLGLFDVATELGLEKHNEDFGQTLGYWGIGSGPYLVLPFLGPSSIRDGLGLLVDLKTDPMTYISHSRTRNQFYGAFFVSRRSELLEASKILETAALDPYEFVRDGYLQRRRNLVYDGNPPDENDIEIKVKPRQNGAGASSFPSPVEEGLGAILTSGYSPTPAELEARKTAAPPAPVAEPRAEPAPQARTRVVKVWLPDRGN